MTHTRFPTPRIPRLGRLAAAARAAAPRVTALVEVMEPRRLLAATGGTIVLNGRHVEATGTSETLVDDVTIGGNDVMRIERVGTDDVLVTVNEISRRFDMDDVDSYALRGLDGPDQITKASNDIRGTVILDGGGTVGPGGGPFDGADDTLTGTNATFSKGDTIRDPTGRIVASRSDDSTFGLSGTDAAEVITLRVDGDAPVVEIGSSFVGRFVAGEYAGLTRSPGFFVSGRGGNDDVRVLSGGWVVGGGDGNDVFTVSEGAFAELFGGAGNDLARPLGSTLNVTLQGGDGDGTDTVELDRQSGIDLSEHDFDGVENVTNAQGTVVGNDLDNRITVRAGDTRPLTALGGGGDDTITGGGGNDNLSGDGGNDTLIGNDGNDTLAGNDGDDNLQGNAGDDDLDGGPGIDTLDGGSGQNTLTNGENDPGTQPQIFLSDRVLVANGTLGNDTFNVVQVDADHVRVTVNQVTGTFEAITYDRIEFVGGAGNDTMTAGAGVAGVFMLGGAGDDRMTGNEVRNSLQGGDGNDTLDARGGPDGLFGQGGNDNLDGGEGDDFMEGGIGNDSLTGGPGRDSMHGNEGDDTLSGGDDDDLLDGGPGTDSLSGGPGNDIERNGEGVPPPLVADAYVRDGPYSRQNFGFAPNLQVKNVTAPGYSRKSYLKFHLSGLPPEDQINSAQIRVFGRMLDTRAPSVVVGVRGIFTTSWNEELIVWDYNLNGGSILDTETVSGTTGRWYTLDVTEWVKDNANNGTEVSFELSAPSLGEGWAGFNSDESGVNPPQLIINDGTPPPPPPPPPPPSGPVTLRSPADGYVRDGSHANTNFGQAGDLQVKNVTAPGWSREGYVRFDLTGVSSADQITSAQVRLFGRKLDTVASSVTVGLYAVTAQNWTESGLTWNTRPAAAATPVATKTLTSTTAAWHVFDVTGFLKQQKAAGAVSVAFALRAPTVSEGWAGFNSDEAPGNRPELLVTTA